MDESPRMGCGKTGRRLGSNPHDLGQGESDSPPQTVLQRDAVDKLHDQQQQAADLVDLIDRHHVRMIDLGGGAGLAEETRAIASSPRCGVSTLTATSRPSTGSRAWNTTPIPPRSVSYWNCPTARATAKDLLRQVGRVGVLQAVLAAEHIDHRRVHAGKLAPGQRVLRVANP